MSCLMEARGLSCGYRGEAVIREVSLAIGEGEFLGIIGPNGAGKTTLFRALTKIIPPLAGEILFAGRPLRLIAPLELARRVAVLPQTVETLFGFSVGEFVAMGRFPHVGRFGAMTAADRAAVASAMRMTDIEGFESKVMGELSGGERQRALIAQALAQEPELFLLDEPTAHLDIGHSASIMDILHRLNREKGVSVCVVLHNLNEASEYCDRLALLCNGRVFSEGAPAEVLTYQNIEAVYKTVVVVRENPISRRPHVVAVPRERLERDAWRD